MKLTHLALACAVAAGGSAAFAQNEAANANTAAGQPSQSASDLGNKAKSGLHSLGEKTRNAFNKLRGKTDQAKADHDAKDDTRSMGAGKAATRDAKTSSSMATDDSSSSRQQRMDQAYSNYQTQKK